MSVFGNFLSSSSCHFLDHILMDAEYNTDMFVSIYTIYIYIYVYMHTHMPCM